MADNIYKGLMTMSRKFSLKLRVRYAECDAQQVVFNARYADYIDVAATEYIRALFGGYQNIIAKGMDTQVVNMNISWKAPARFDDVLVISVVPQKVGNTSYTLAINFVNEDSLVEIAFAQITYVMVDIKEYVKMSIPDDFRATLLDDKAPIIIDQSGISSDA
jgi:acyl-CoA thioester hydrolase